MSEHEHPKSKPTHRISFARINGRDETGKDILGPAREIGTIWSRAGKEGEGILRFDHTPREPGVYFVREVEPQKAQAAERAAPSAHSETVRSESERDR
mgnify:CR=1 FL=1